MSTTRANTNSLELSFDELRWLAGAFGAARLPLKLVKSAPISLNGTQALLQQRSIIQRGKPGWQVEPFTALIMQWMLSAEHFWIFERFTPNGKRTEFTLFMADSAALLVMPLPQGKHFVACANLDTAILEWQQAAGLPISTATETLPEWDVPQPVTIIRSSWKNPDLAKNMAPPLFLDWARRLDWAGEWLLVQDQTRFSRLAVAAQGNHAWAGRWVPGKPGEFVLRAWQPDMLKQIFWENV